MFLRIGSAIRAASSSSIGSSLAQAESCCRQARALALPVILLLTPTDVRLGGHLPSPCSIISARFSITPITQIIFFTSHTGNLRRTKQRRRTGRYHHPTSEHSHSFSHSAFKGWVGHLQLFKVSLSCDSPWQRKQGRCTRLTDTVHVTFYGDGQLLQLKLGLLLSLGSLRCRASEFGKCAISCDLPRLQADPAENWVCASISCWSACAAAPCKFSDSSRSQSEPATRLCDEPPVVTGLAPAGEEFLV